VRTVWNAAAELASSPVTQRLLLPALKSACEHLNAASAVDPAFQAAVNALLCSCYASAQQHECGLRHVEAALKRTPAKQHAQLWAWRTELLRSAQPRLAAELHGMGGYPAEVQAALWANLAASCSSERDQLEALRRAVAASAANPWLQVRVAAFVPCLHSRCQPTPTAGPLPVRVRRVAALR